MKTCTKCGQEKPLTEFYKDKRISDGRKSRCKECLLEERKQYYQQKKEYNKKYYQDNKEKIKKYSRQYSKQYYQDNKEKVKQYYQDNKKQIKAQRKQYQQDNKEQIKEYLKQYREDNRERLKEQRKQYYQDNKEQIREYYRQRRSNDPFFKFKEGIRGAIKAGFRTQGYSKNSKTFEILGCSFEHLMNWLDFEKWNNEDCHIDHIIPISLAKNEDDALLLSHYTNLQVLSAEDNLKKGNRNVKFENLIKVVNNHPEPTKITEILNNSNINLL